MVALGGEAGTNKTTLGTPDTYFCTSDGKYVFVEYTTQKNNLFAKIKADLNKCLDTAKTGISYDKISEIIYCHTSSNITPSQDSELKALCEKNGIEFTIIGIDKLAEDLYLFHHGLSRDFLGISLSTDQIQTYADFIKYYNANRMAAPIDFEFLFREEELNNINDSFQKYDIIILSGAAGTGKTRLALHYAKNYADIHKAKMYCIHSNALPIYEDLKLYINNPGNYILFVDDANQLTGLQHIIHYTTKKSEGYNVKIIITVRDYALKKLVNDIREINEFENIIIRQFTDEQIKSLIETSLGITNPDYKERIARIADGNARIAILAGKLACVSHSLDSINDVSQLFDDYYGTFLSDNQLLIDNELCITAGVIAFLEAIHLDHIDAFLPILQEKGISRDCFIEKLYLLHEHEIVDICNDKAVRFSEQCLSNYLLKYVFFDKKLISLSAMVQTCFQKYKERTITSINTLINIFRNEDIFSFVEHEIKALWDELAKENSPYFFDFVKVFYRINPTETLIILQDKIDLEETVNIQVSDIDTEKANNYQSIDNDIIEILCGFANSDDLPTALELLFRYYLKRLDLFAQFCKAIKQFFGIKKDSIRCNYYTQITFFKKLREYSNDLEHEAFVILFLEIAKDFLELHFSPFESGRGHSIIVYQIQLVISEGVREYRKLIWESLLKLCKNKNHIEAVRKILDTYGSMVDEVSYPVLQFDLSYIKAIMESYFPPNELQNCLLAKHLSRIYANTIASCETLFNEYFEGEIFTSYILLKGPDFPEKIDYLKYKESKNQSIEAYVSKCDLKAFKRLIDVCSIIDDIKSHKKWEIAEGLNVAFDAIAENEIYVEAIKYYIEKNTPIDLHPYHLISKLFSLLSEKKVFEMINESEFDQKNFWLYSYYHELPSKMITKKHVRGLCAFLADDSDKNSVSSFRDMDFLKKYTNVDEEVFIKACRIILDKKFYSLVVVNMYFGLMFNHMHNSPQDVIQMFNNDLDLLENIYCTLLSYDSHHDYNGLFLKGIYLVKPSILDKYIEYLINGINGTFRDYRERDQSLFLTEDFLNVYNKIFESLLEKCKFPKLSVSDFLESILLSNSGNQELLKRQDLWIRQCIQRFSNDKLKMYCLFSVISKLSIDRKKEYILYFIENNQSFEDFKAIPLTPTSYGWSGSAIPVYSSWIEFLESLLPNFIGLKWIKHKNLIETKISDLKRKIEFEQIEEILRG